MKVQFAGFTIDPGTRQLLRDGSECHLPPKAFDLLWSLIERRPGVVEKTDLHARLWPGTFVVDGSLNVLIGQIRRAIGDDPQRPRFVRTVHGVGYAFCGDAVAAPAQAAAAGQTRCWLTRGGKTHGLAEGENVIGRDPGCNVWLDVPGVSRRHAQVVVSGDVVVVEDLGSRNGTFVADTPVLAPRPLHDGEMLHIGPVEVQFRLWSGANAKGTERIARGNSPSTQLDS